MWRSVLAPCTRYGIVHRDLKPSNILLVDGRARIADLGIAADGPSELTDVGTMVGTLAYLAPEQLAGQPASPASDVHALGVIAFLAITGRLPRPAESVGEVVAASTRPVGPVSLLEPGLGPAFDPAIGRALDVEPSRRPSAIDLATALSAALAQWRTLPRPGAGEDETTLISLPIPGPGDSALDPASAGGRDGRIVAVVILLVAAVVLGSIVVLLALAGGSADRASPTPSIGPTDSGSSPSPSASTSPSPTPTSSATLAPAPTVDPFTTAGTASTEMRAVIASSRGKGGLKGREAKDLEGLLDQFDRSVRERDASAAREAANKLAEQVAALIERQAIDAQTAAPLQTASDRLRAVANALPG